MNYDDNAAIIEEKLLNERNNGKKNKSMTFTYFDQDVDVEVGWQNALRLRRSLKKRLKAINNTL